MYVVLPQQQIRVVLPSPFFSSCLLPVLLPPKAGCLYSVCWQLSESWASDLVMWKPSTNELLNDSSSCWLALYLVSISAYSPQPHLSRHRGQVLTPKSPCLLFGEENWLLSSVCFAGYSCAQFYLVPWALTSTQEWGWEWELTVVQCSLQQGRSCHKMPSGIFFQTCFYCSFSLSPNHDPQPDYPDMGQ